MSTLKDYYRDRYAGSGIAGPGMEVEPTFRRRVDAGLRALGSKPLRVLDFGCNTGAASALLAAAGHHVSGTDISESAVAHARARVPGVEFRVVDSESRLPFEDAGFDACFASEVIEHLFDVPAFLEEVARVLVPGGLLVVTTPFHGLVKNLLVVALNFERHFDPTGGHIRFFTVRSLERCLVKAGFAVESVSGVGRPWPLWKSMVVCARKRH